MVKQRALEPSNDIAVAGALFDLNAELNIQILVMAGS